MPRRAKAIPRNQPDTLAKLCWQNREKLERAIGLGLLGRQDTLQVQLVRLYLSMEGIWDKDRERELGKGHNLPSLKYETFHLVIKALTQITEPGNIDLFSKIGEIEFAINNHAYSYSLEIIGKSLPKSLEIEEFGLALHLLDLQARVYDHLAGDFDLFALVEENNQLRESTLALFNELQACSALRRVVVEPIKATWEKNEKVDESAINLLEAEIGKISSNEIRSNRAKLDLLSASTLYCLLTKDNQRGLALLAEVIDLYESNQMLKRDNHYRYIQHLRAFTILNAHLGNEFKARECLDILWQNHLVSTGSNLLALQSWIRAGLRVSFHSKDPLLSNHVISEFEVHYSRLESFSKESDWVRLNWWTMINLIENDELERANKFGLSLLDKKASLKVNQLLCVRIAVFAIGVALYAEDESRMSDSYHSTYEFLRRYKQDFPDAISVLKRFFGLWKKWNTGGDYALDSPMPVSLYPTKSLGEGNYDFKVLLRLVALRLKGRQLRQ